MIDQLTIIAVNIAALRVEADKLSDPIDRKLLEMVIAYLESVFIDLSANPNLLEGEMPWWEAWRARPSEFSPLV